MSSYDTDVPPVSVRLPRALLAKVDALLAKVDALVALYNATEHGRTTRSMMLQELVRVGLRRLEGKQP